MLTLKGVTIHLQDFGTILCIHLVGASKQDIEERYFSFWNHKTTGGELEWENDVVSPYHAFFWIYSTKKATAVQKLKQGLVMASLFEMLPPMSHEHTKGRNIYPEACVRAEERFAKIDHVTWLDFSTESDFGIGYRMGDAVAAEKETGNFDDDVLGRVVTRGGNMTLDMVKAQKEHTDETERDEEDVGEDVQVG